MWAKRAHLRDTRDSGDMKSEKTPSTLLIPNQGDSNTGDYNYVNIKVEFLAIITILFMDLIVEIKDILLHNLGYNKYIIYRED